MKHAVKLPAVTPRSLRVIVTVAALLVVLALLWYAISSELRGQEADTRTDERDAARGAAEQVIDCVNDPDVTTTDECEAEAEEAQETLEDEVPPATLSSRQRREVVLIAARLIAAQPDLSADDVADEVIEQLPDVEDGGQGERGPRGPAGADGETPSTEEIRALVDAVYDANPPAPGDDGTDGTNGAAGRDGKDATPEMVDAAVGRYCSVRGECAGPEGPRGPEGPQGPAGPQGDAGAEGTAGRGIASMSCDPETEMFVVTYTDGSNQLVEGSDCVANGPLGLG